MLACKLWALAQANWNAAKQNKHTFLPLFDCDAKVLKENKQNNSKFSSTEVHP